MSSCSYSCWYVFAAYIYAGSRCANATGAAFLPQAIADACSSTFSSNLLRRGLVSLSLFLPASSPKCNLPGDPVPFTAGDRPCQFSTISAICSAVYLSNSTAACSSTSAPRDLAANQSACVACQNTVIAAAFDLFNVTGSKEFVTCGMAATIAIWSAYPTHVA